MDCPKCKVATKEREMRTLQGLVTYDQCTSCKGFWFDTGEAEKLKDQWRPDFIDRGDPETGKEFNKIRDVNCPAVVSRWKKSLTRSNGTFSSKPVVSTVYSWTLANSGITRTRR